VRSHANAGPVLVVAVMVAFLSLPRPLRRSLPAGRWRP